MLAEIWRKPIVPGFPVKFTVGQPPEYIDSEGGLTPVENCPEIKDIQLAIGGWGASKAYRDPCYVVRFVNSPMCRVIPINEVKDVLWLTPTPDKAASTTPALED